MPEKSNRKGVSLKSPPIAGKGGIARIAGKGGIEAIERRDSDYSDNSDYRYYKYYKYYRHYNIYLPVREAKPKRSFIRGDWQSRSEVLASKGLRSV